MKHLYYDIEKNGIIGSSGSGAANYRFIEPPIITYFVTTIDKYGNVNVSPISLGTLMGIDDSKQGGQVGYFSFSLLHFEKRSKLIQVQEKGEEEEMDRQFTIRDTEHNLEDNGECVISYITKNQIKEMRITGCPIPRGIDEGEIAGLTHYNSNKVTPPCIKECPVNMEAKIIFSKLFGNIKLYICEIIALHVDEYFDKLDKQTAGHP